MKMEEPGYQASKNGNPSALCIRDGWNRYKALPDQLYMAILGNSKEYFNAYQSLQISSLCVIARFGDTFRHATTM